MNRAKSVLAKEEGKIVSSFAPARKEKGAAALAGLKDALKEFDDVLAREDKQAIPGAQKKCLDFVSTIEESMVQGFPFEVPAAYKNLPQLKGRAEVQMKVCKATWRRERGA